MKTKFEKWEKIRRKGIWYYVFVYGVIAWGFSSAIAWAFLFPLTIPGNDEITFFSVLPLSFTIFPIGGLAFGTLMWFFIERRYKKERNSEQAAAGDP